MLFNSYQFVFVFLPVAMIGFFLLGRVNRLWAAGWLALASIVFYGYWSVKYIPPVAGIGDIQLFMRTGHSPGAPKRSQGAGC